MKQKNRAPRTLLHRCGNPSDFHPPTSSSQVVTDFSYQAGDELHIIGVAKSPKVFDHFIGELMEQMRDGSPARLDVESVPTAYDGYKGYLDQSSCRCICQLSPV